MTFELLNASGMTKSAADPCNALLPLLVTIVMKPPVRPPSSASAPSVLI